jgi:hypothetical protein
VAIENHITGKNNSFLPLSVELIITQIIQKIQKIQFHKIQKPIEKYRKTYSFISGSLGNFYVIQIFAYTIIIEKEY